jgi:tetratricopeptide (TPR) repeat protein
LYRQGKNLEAESLMREAIEINRRVWGAVNPETALAINDLASALSSQGKFAEAEPLYREALGIYRQTLPATHPKLGEALNNLALLLERQGRFDEAEPLYREALKNFRHSLSPESIDLATCLTNIGLLLHRQKKLDQAEAHLREALQIARKTPGHPFTANTLNGLAAVRLDQGAGAEAEPFFREALELLERAETPERWKLGVARYGLGRALTALNRYADAENELVEAEQILAAGDAVGPPFHSRCIEAFVALYSDWDKAEPGKGIDKKAAAWQSKLSSNKTRETQPNAPTATIAPVQPPSTNHPPESR